MFNSLPKISKKLITVFILGFLSAWISIYFIKMFLNKTPPAKVLIQENNDLQSQINQLQKKLRGLLAKSDRFYATSISCSKDPDEKPEIRDFLPEKIKNKVGEKEIPEDIRTYDLYPLAWSKDCSKLAFLIELVGRGAGAYKPQDFEQRGIYIFNDITKEVKLAKLLSIDHSIDSQAYDSNFWSGENYIFVESTNKSKSEWTSKRYEYDSNTGKVTISK